MHIDNYTADRSNMERSRIELKRFVRNLSGVHPPFLILRGYDKPGFNLDSISDTTNEELEQALNLKVKGDATCLFEADMADMSGKTMFLKLVKEFSKVPGNGEFARVELEQIKAHDFKCATDFIDKFNRLRQTYKLGSGQDLPPKQLTRAFISAFDSDRGAADLWKPMYVTWVGQQGHTIESLSKTLETTADTMIENMPSGRENSAQGAVTRTREGCIFRIEGQPNPCSNLFSFSASSAATAVEPRRTSSWATSSSRPSRARA